MMKKKMFNDVNFTPTEFSVDPIYGETTNYDNLLETPCFEGLVGSLDAPFFLPTHNELIDAGFDEVTANNILDDSHRHSYTDKELFEVLHSDNPVQAYRNMMDLKAHDAIHRADELIESIEQSGILK